MCTRELLTEWVKRNRKYEWPSPELVAAVTAEDAQLVATGSKLSSDRDVEWRVCFVPGEMRLTHSLNDTQCKLYVLLKRVNKTMLVPINAEMSSYIMKNVVFWMSESYPSNAFVPRNLLKLLSSALVILRHALTANHLAYYMIPQRNLLIGRASPQERERLISILADLIDAGPEVVFRVSQPLAGALSRPEGQVAADGKVGL